MSAFGSSVRWCCAILAVVASAPGQSLRLDTEEIGRGYCLEPSGTLTLRLSLRLKLTNDSAQNVIVSRFGQIVRAEFSLATTSGVPTTLALSSSRFYTYPIRGVSLSNQQPRPPANRLMVLLRPGESYSFVDRTHLQLRSGVEFSILGSTWRLRVHAIMWRSSPMLAQSLRAEWTDLGTLMSDPVTSADLTVKVDEHPVIGLNSALEPSAEQVQCMFPVAEK
jgi:hypothetical protein